VPVSEKSADHVPAVGTRYSVIGSETNDFSFQWRRHWTAPDFYSPVKTGASSAAGCFSERVQDAEGVATNRPMSTIFPK
jgi:hypothetical protein